jgi:hypothetical protein
MMIALFTSWRSGIHDNRLMSNVEVTRESLLSPTVTHCDHSLASATIQRSFVIGHGFNFIFTIGQNGLFCDIYLKSKMTTTVMMIGHLYKVALVSMTISESSRSQSRARTLFTTFSLPSYRYPVVTRCGRC